MPRQLVVSGLSILSDALDDYDFITERQYGKAFDRVEDDTFREIWDASSKVLRRYFSEIAHLPYYLNLGYLSGKVSDADLVNIYNELRHLMGYSEYLFEPVSESIEEIEFKSRNLFKYVKTWGSLGFLLNYFNYGTNWAEVLIKNPVDSISIIDPVYPRSSIDRQTLLLFPQIEAGEYLVLYPLTMGNAEAFYEKLFSYLYESQPAGRKPYLGKGGVFTDTVYSEAWLTMEMAKRVVLTERIIPVDQELFTRVGISHMNSLLLEWEVRPGLDISHLMGFDADVSFEDEGKVLEVGIDHAGDIIGPLWNINYLFMIQKRIVMEERIAATDPSHLFSPRFAGFMYVVDEKFIQKRSVWGDEACGEDESYQLSRRYSADSVSELCSVVLPRDVGACVGDQLFSSGLLTSPPQVSLSASVIKESVLDEVVMADEIDPISDVSGKVGDAVGLYLYPKRYIVKHLIVEESALFDDSEMTGLEDNLIWAYDPRLPSFWTYFVSD